VSMREILIETILAIVLASAGVLAIARPRWLQHWALHVDPFRRFNPAKGYIATQAYLSHTRIAGVAAVAMALLLALAAYVTWSQLR